MTNKYFLDEKISFDDLFFVCYMIERTARKIHQRNRYVVKQMGCDGLYHELSLAQVSHSLNPEQVESEWIDKYSLTNGCFDVTDVNAHFTERIPSAIEMGKVYARLIESLDMEGDLIKTIINCYDSPICNIIDNYDTGAFYEPSYVQTRAVINGEF